MSDDLRALMYGADEDEGESRPKRPLPTPGDTSPLVRRVVVGPIVYEVPSLEYVRRLENALQQQDAAMRRMAREIGLLRSAVRGARRDTGRDGGGEE